MNFPLKYDYNLPWRGVVSGTVFYVGLSILMAHLARGATTMIFAGLIALSAVFAVFASIVATRRLIFPRILELNEDSILFPHGFLRTRITRIRYSDIIRTTYGGFERSAGFSIVLSRKRFEVVASRFPGINDYYAMRDFIYSQVSIGTTMNEKPERPGSRGGFPNPLLCWVEPNDWPRYRTSSVASKPLLPRLGKTLRFFVSSVVLIFLPWLLLHLFQLPTMPAANFLRVVIPVALFFTSLHWLNATHPAYAMEISIRDQGITVSNGKQTWDWNYHDFSGWTVIERQFDESVLHIVLLKRPTHMVAFALPDSTVRDRLVQIFRDKKVLESPALKPSWESNP